jgi:diguanylate cyclase (GGDEF)-like protein
MQLPPARWLRRLVVGTTVISANSGAEADSPAREPLGTLLLPLVSTRFQPQLLVARRAATILYRVRLVAAAFALLTVAWIPVDALMLDAGTRTPVAIGRLVAACAFLTLALAAWRANSLQAARLAVAILVLIPSAFFVFAATQWTQATLADESFGLRGVYAAVPFVVASGLGLFPLTAIEAAAASLPIFLAEAAVAALDIQALTPMETLGSLWLLALVTGVAGLAGMAQVGLMSQLLRQMAHDPLTGAYRRATGEELLALEMGLARRSDIALAVLFIDLDRFKSINDQFGHEVGDQVLQHAARAILDQMREGDLLVRWGGEEFVVVLPNMRCADAGRFLERVRATGLGARPDGKTVTASVGISERLADAAAEWWQLVDLADRRMYEAKRAGRDRYVGCGGSP